MHFNKRNKDISHTINKANWSYGELQELQEIFRKFDSDSDGYISEIELRELMKRFVGTLSDDNITEMIKFADIDFSGHVDLDEFLLIMSQRQLVKVKRKERETMIDAFKVFDLNNDGRISEDELKCVLYEIGEKVDDERIKEIMKLADIDNNGHLDYKEFATLLLNLKKK